MICMRASSSFFSVTFFVQLLKRLRQTSEHIHTQYVSIYYTHSELKIATVLCAQLQQLHQFGRFTAFFNELKEIKTVFKGRTHFPVSFFFKYISLSRSHSLI